MIETSKIYLGDCTEVMKRFDDNSVDVTFTSPPYNRVRDDVYDEYKEAQQDYALLLDEFTKQALRISRDKVIINIQQTYFNKKILFDWIGRFGGQIAGTVVWVKTNARPGVNFDGDTRSVSNCYEYFYVLTDDGDKFRAYGEEETKNYIITPVNDFHVDGHSAIMRLDVAQWFIKKFTRETDIVIDPFMGMGTTAVACESLNRKWVGIEQSEVYIDMAYQRLKDGSQTILF